MMSSFIITGRARAGIMSLALAFALAPLSNAARAGVGAQEPVFTAVPLTAGGALAEGGAPPAGRMIGVTPDRAHPKFPADLRTLAADHYRLAVGNREDIEGPYSPGLIQDLLGLAEAQDAAGEHALAARTLERARHLSRVNHGLYSEEQIVIVERAAASLTAAGEWAAAEERLLSLLDMRRTLYGERDPRTVPALQGLGIWKLEAFKRMIDGPNGERTQLSAIDSLQQAQAYFIEAVTLLMESGEQADPALPAVEERLVETYFLQATLDTLLGQRQMSVKARHPALDFTDYGLASQVRRTASFRAGVEAYLRMIGHLRRQPDAGDEQYASALLGLGDWYLLFGHQREARRQYELAERFLAEGNAPRDSLSETLDPALPVALPAFAPSPPPVRPLSQWPDTTSDEDYQGYIDLAFTVNRHGRAENLNVLGRSGETGVAVEKRLLGLVKDTLYRPAAALAQGEEAAYRLRYFYAYPDQ